MQMPGRHGNTGDYRYGFQGQETDDEITGSESHVSYTYRCHDTRLGRFLSVDPLTAKYPHYSPYSFSGNRVIDMVELEGLEPASPGTTADQYESATLDGTNDTYGWTWTEGEKGSSWVQGSSLDFYKGTIHQPSKSPTDDKGTGYDPNVDVNTWWSNDVITQMGNYIVSFQAAMSL
jgi:RHS repeat-associated protein